jgi:hypothetical protein
VRTSCSAAFLDFGIEIVAVVQLKRYDEIEEVGACCASEIGTLYLDFANELLSLMKYEVKIVGGPLE